MNPMQGALPPPSKRISNEGREDRASVKANPVPEKPEHQVPEQDAGRSPTELAARWEKELQAAKRELSKFHTTGRRLVQRYLDERDSSAMDNGSDAKFNLFWSNIEVLKSSLYAKPPKVDVSNTYKDSEDDVSRVAGTILERLLNHDVEEDDESTFPDITRQAVSDYLIVGLGQVWYRYEVEIEEQETDAVIDPQTGIELAPAVKFESIESEEAPADYVYWEDFWWSPARTWGDVRWVARRVYMNREELKARFGDKIGAQIPISKGKKNDGIGPQNDPWEKAAVFEIWDKTTECVYWHVIGFNVICDYKEDPLELRGFFPCPPPLIANVTTSKVMPRADYLLAQDQYAQIDELTTRLKYLVKACKVVGVYDKNSTAIGRVFTEGMENQMIPVDNWAAFAEKGGMQGQMDFVPIEVIAGVIERLTAQREVLKQNLYEVLGIGDIMRGMTNPDETLGAQQLKAQFGGNRLQFKQQQIGGWVASGQRIKAQIICDKWQPQTILSRSNIEHSFDAQLAGQAIELLKSDEESKFYRITIESETMAMIDWAQERDSRTQFMQAVGSFVQSVTPLLEAQPAAGPVVLQMMKWGLGGFRISKEIESVLDQAIQAATQTLQNPTPEPPDPKQESEIEKNKAVAQKDTTQAARNLSEAHLKGAEAQLMGMPAPGGMPMQPPPNVAPLQAAPVPGAPMQ